MKHKNIKNDRISVLIDKNTKKIFMSVCKSKDLDASKVIRMLIKDYVIKNSSLFN